MCYVCCCEHALKHCGSQRDRHKPGTVSASQFFKFCSKWKQCFVFAVSPHQSPCQRGEGIQAMMTSMSQMTVMAMSLFMQSTQPPVLNTETKQKSQCLFDCNFFAKGFHRHITRILKCFVKSGVSVCVRFRSGGLGSKSNKMETRRCCHWRQLNRPMTFWEHPCCPQ